MRTAFDVGALLWGTFRRQLAAYQAAGAKITYVEGRGMLSRVFVVEGSPAELRALHRAVASLLDSER